MGEQVDLINRGDPAILVGTQMLAKGHHFPALNLVVVLDIDQGLYNPDFRGPEKTVQLLTQVAGRAGRTGHAGKVLIQTHLPEHPLLQIWQTESYQGIVDTLLNERSLRALPPYTHIALIRADSHKPEHALQFLNNLAHQQANIFQQNSCQPIGPLAAVMEKRAGRHRAQLMIKSKHRKSLHGAVKQLIQWLEQSKKPSGLRWSVDIDPQDVI
jgi:primosomal protein N' (replication factor Y)